MIPNLAASNGIDPDHCPPDVISCATKELIDESTNDVQAFVATGSSSSHLP